MENVTNEDDTVEHEEPVISHSISVDESDAGDPNPALQEPDALSLVLGDVAPTSVAHSRKEALLQQARADRRKWIQKVPLPFASARDPHNVWLMDDRLAKVQSSLACRQLPTATKVLSELYGMSEHARTKEEIAERVESLIGTIPGEEAPTPSADTYAPPAEIVPGELDDSVLKAYKGFWTKLMQPECALLVQGMRNFLRSLETSSSLESMGASVKSYLEKTNESLKSHVAWKDDTDHELLRRSLESFVYGQLQGILEAMMEWNDLFPMSESEWVERINQLQFVEPSHLEIECLQMDGVNLDDILQQPKEALLSVDRYFSPYEKLQRILKVYQGVNEALSTALNHHQQESDGPNDEGKKERKLPSADDVLPTIILTVLRARPDRVFRNLQFVEMFCPPEYLRGEAGYAYTNLYGAVQFLLDLDMDKPTSLAINQEEFRAGLEKWKASTQKRVLEISENINQPRETVRNVDISVQDVREARLRGEIVNFEWALKWQEAHPPTSSEQTAGMESTAEDEVLPVGFTRSYTYLNSRPEDIRLSDLPNLLNEYRMLVHTTERLLGERSARIQSKKRQQKSQRKQLLHENLTDGDADTERGNRERVHTS